MQVRQAAAAIREVVASEIEDVRPILGGWAYWTFDVDGEWIFRFPRTDVIAAAAEAEQRLLPVLAVHVDFEVPVPEWSGTFGGRPFFGYRKLHGRPLQRTDFEHDPMVSDRLVSMLRQIHSFDVEMAKRLLGVEGSVSAWQRRYRDLRAAAVTNVVGLLDAPIAARVEDGLGRLIDGHVAFTPTLVHCDLGTDHILVDPATSLPMGIIDFEDATVGDPAIDFVGFWITLGPAQTQVLLDAYRDDLDTDFVQRIKTYWWIGSLHAVLYGLDQNDPAIVDDGLAGLRMRLGTLDS